MSTHRTKKKSNGQGAGGLPAWTPFERAVPTGVAPGNVTAVARLANLPEAVVARQMMDELAGAEMWQNSRYLVIKKLDKMHDGVSKVWHLSFRRLDRLPVGRERFRDFQRIKNELLGPEMTGFEIYPAESRLADTSNQYHIWAYEDGRGFPFGYRGRAVLDADMGLVQRPLGAS